MNIRPETPADIDAIRQVNRLAFGQDGEARLVDALRDGGYVRLSLVAEVDGRIVGHILFSELPILSAGGTVPALALAPLAVLPEYQRRGIGTALVRHGLDHCRERLNPTGLSFREDPQPLDRHTIVVVLGHPHYYPRFGFSAELAVPLKSRFSGEAWMALELTPRALADVTGVVQYPPPFNAFG